MSGFDFFPVFGLQQESSRVIVSVGEVHRLWLASIELDRRSFNYTGVLAAVKCTSTYSYLIWVTNRVLMFLIMIAIIIAIVFVIFIRLRVDSINDFFLSANGVTQ